GRILLGRPVRITQLRPARDARLDRVTLAVVRDALVQLGHEFGPLRTRADEAHLPAQHVEDLRQLVDPRQPDDRAEARDAAVVLLGPLRLAVRLRVLAHAAELQQAERLGVLSDAPWAVEDRGPWTFDELDGERRQQHERRREHEQREARDDVENALQGRVDAPLAEALRE